MGNATSALAETARLQLTAGGLCRSRLDRGGRICTCDCVDVYDGRGSGRGSETGPKSKSHSCTSRQGIRTKPTGQDHTHRSVAYFTRKQQPEGAIPSRHPRDCQRPNPATNQPAFSQGVAVQPAEAPQPPAHSPVPGKKPAASGAAGFCLYDARATSYNRSLHRRNCRHSSCRHVGFGCRTHGTSAQSSH